MNSESKGQVHCNLCGAWVGMRSDMRFIKDGHIIVQCPACSLLFVAKIPSQQELRNIYSESYFEHIAEHDGSQGYLDYVADELQHRRNAKKRIKTIVSLLGKTGKLLDVGAAAGFFMNEAEKEGFVVEGVDVSETMVVWGRKHFGLPLALGTFQDIAIPNETFDVVTMWDYIEHSIDPKADFKKIASLLSPGGMVAFSTGDVRSICARVFGKRWHLLTPQHHNFYFSKKVLQKYLEDAGFSAVRIVYETNHYPLRYIVYKLGSIFNLNFLRSLPIVSAKNRWGSLSIPLNLWDIVTIYAVKNKS